MKRANRDLAAADRRLGALLVLPALAVLALFSAAPILASAALGLRRIVSGLPALGEPFVGLDNYRALWASAVVRQSIATTLRFVAASTALEILLGLSLALCLDAALRGRGWVRAALLVPWALPTVVAAQMWRFLWNDRYGPIPWYLAGGGAPLADPGAALAAIVIGDVWKTAPFVALILLAGLQAIPAELHEAAAVDGAGALRRFTRITLPLLAPALLVALLFRTIDAFRVFDLVWVLTQGGPADATLVLQLLGYRRMFSEGFVGEGAAISTVVFALTFLVSVAYVRLAGSRLWSVER